VAFAADVDAGSRREIEAVLGGWDPALFPGGDVEVSVLVGGASNRNFVARTPAAKYALRIANSQSERFAVDREAAIQAQREAAGGGLGPEVVASRLPEGHVLSAFVEGATLGEEQLCEREVLETVGATLRRLHALPSSLRAYSPFDDIQLWARLARSDGTEVPADLDELLGAVRRIEVLVASSAKTTPTPRTSSSPARGCSWSTGITPAAVGPASSSAPSAPRPISAPTCRRSSCAHTMSARVRRKWRQSS
jgi:hypothetical protein